MNSLKTINKKFLLFATISLFLLSCDSNEISNKKQKLLVGYINELEIEQGKGKQNYLIVPPHVCHSCIETTYKFLKNNKIPIKVILVGQTTYDSAALIIKYPNFKVYLDKKELYYNRKNLEMVVQDIVFLKLEKEKIAEYIEIDIDELNKALNKIILIGEQ